MRYPLFLYCSSIRSLSHVFEICGCFHFGFLTYGLVSRTSQMSQGNEISACQGLYEGSVGEPNITDEPGQCLARLETGSCVGSSDWFGRFLSAYDRTKLLLDIVDHLAIAVAAMLAKPRNNKLYAELLLFQKLDGLSQDAITGGVNFRAPDSRIALSSLLAESESNRRASSLLAHAMPSLARLFVDLCSCESPSLPERPTASRCSAPAKLGLSSNQGLDADASRQERK